MYTVTGAVVWENSVVSELTVAMDVLKLVPPAQTDTSRETGPLEAVNQVRNAVNTIYTLS